MAYQALMPTLLDANSIRRARSSPCQWVSRHAAANRDLTGT